MTSTERAEGFTLLEMLVVLLIAGIAMALTSQALGQYQRAHTRLIASERSIREQRLSSAWFRASVGGLQPTGRVDFNGTLLARAVEPFAGDARQFSGMTLAPVLPGPGAPVRQEWSIVATPDGLEHLTLREAGDRIELVFPRTDALRFTYLDQAGKSHALWPPAKGEWPELPAAVMLDASVGPGPPAIVIVQSVLGPRDPVFRQYEFQRE